MKYVMEYVDYVDEFIKIPYREFKIDVPKNMFEFCEPYIHMKNARILDCGCASGAFVEWLQDRSWISYAYGVDTNTNLLRWAADHNRKNVGYGDINGLPMEDDTYDITFSCHVIGHAEDIGLALDEMYRVTAPDGYIAVLLGIPGGRKHYHCIEDDTIFKQFTERYKLKVKYCGFPAGFRPKEYVSVLQKATK